MAREKSNGRRLTRTLHARVALAIVFSLALTLAWLNLLQASETSDSHLTIWGVDALQPPLEGGDVTANARLVDFRESTRGAPLPGRVITFSFADESIDVTTDADGGAQATFSYAPSQIDVISVAFDGDGAFQPSMDRAWLKGDIVVSVGGGMAHRYDASGEFINAFDSTTGSPDSVGMCFDSAHNLYMVSFQARVISKFDRSTGEVIPDWASGFQVSPESCTQAEEDLDGDLVLEDVIYAGEQDGQNLIRKFDSDGNLISTHTVAVSGRGADWLDMGNAGTTIRYTSEGHEVFEYDVLNDVQMPEFVIDQSVPSNQTSLRPDSLPENAIDTDPDTAWTTNDGDVANQSVVVDLAGAEQTIDRMFIEGGSLPTAVQSFLLQVSTTGISEASFTTVLVGTSPRTELGESFTFGPVNARYVRLLALDNYGNINALSVKRFEVFNELGIDVAALDAGSSIAAVSSIQTDPLIEAPCYALRTLPDGTLLIACDEEVVHISSDGKSALHRYTRESIGVSETDTIFGLSLATDAESFWASSQTEGRVVNVDIETGEALQTILPVKRGPRVGGVIIFGEPMEGVNYEPVAYSQWVTAFSGSSLEITLTGDDFESEELSFVVTNQPNNGALSGAAPNLVYLSDSGFIGDDVFTFFVSDGVFNSQPATIHVEVQEPNDPPVALAGGPYEVGEGGTVSLDGSGSSDSDGEIVLYEWDLDGDGVFGETGSAALQGDEQGSTVTFSADFLDGPTVAPVTLRVTDDRGVSATDELGIDVANEPPAVDADGNGVELGQFSTLSVSIIDPAIGDTHVADIDWGDGSAIEALGAVNASFTATHIYSEPGLFNVTVIVTDDDGGITEAFAVSAVGEEFLDRPIAISKSVGLAQNSSLQISLSGTDDDLGPNENLDFDLVAPPISGDLSAIVQTGPTSAIVVYTPEEGFLGSDNFVFTVSDRIFTSAPGIVSINVVDPSATGGGGGFIGGDGGSSGGGDGGGQVATVPSQLRFVSLEPGDETATVRWATPESDGGSPILGYRILNLVTGRPQLVPAPASFAKIFDLVNGTDYSFQAQAFNSVGTGPSVIVGPVTPRGVASPPIEVNAALESDRTITVSWQAPLSDGGSPIIEYKVDVVGGIEKARVLVTEPLEANVSDLLPGFAYSFTVTAVTDAGPGEPSSPTDPIFIPVLPGAPEEPSVTPAPINAVPTAQTQTPTTAPTRSPTPVPTVTTAVTQATSTPVPLPSPTPGILASVDGAGGNSLVKLLLIVLGGIGLCVLIFAAVTGRIPGINIGPGR